MAIFTTFLLSRRLAELPTSVDLELVTLSHHKSPQMKETLEKALKKLNEKMAEEESFYQEQFKQIDDQLDELKKAQVEAELKLQVVTEASEHLILACQGHPDFWHAVKDKLADIPALEAYLTNLLEKVEHTWATSTLDLLERDFPG